MFRVSFLTEKYGTYDGPYAGPCGWLIVLWYGASAWTLSSVRWSSGAPNACFDNVATLVTAFEGAPAFEAPMSL